MNNHVTTDIVIFGGGIAGLWLLTRLRQAGFSAILLESGALGGGQTGKSQGIIHGGMKYALQGVLTDEVRAMLEMPKVWRDCLNGQGEINLSRVPVLSTKHYLWSPHKFTSKLTGFIASATLSSKVTAIEKENYPSAFHHPSFKGEVYALDELVIDVPALVRELVRINQDVVFKIEPLTGDEIKFDENGKMQSATVYMAGKTLHVSAQQFIFTAGAGNEIIINKLKKDHIKMQRRPLHMVLVKMPRKHSLYAHCLGFGSRPRITITTHYTQEGEAIWYLGGALAEDGIKRERAEQIQAAQAELQTLFPWIDFSTAEFATFMIDRAEPLQKNGLKPEKAMMFTVENMVIGWPTKLALAPQLATDIMQHLQQLQITPQPVDARELRAWPMPPVAAPVWEDLFCKSVV